MHIGALHSGFASGHLGILRLFKNVKCNQNLKRAIPQLSKMGSLLCLLQIFRELCLFEVEQFYDFGFTQLFEDLRQKKQACI